MKVKNRMINVLCSQFGWRGTPHSIPTSKPCYNFRSDPILSTRRNQQDFFPHFIQGSQGHEASLWKPMFASCSKWDISMLGYISFSYFITLGFWGAFRVSKGPPVLLHPISENSHLFSLKFYLSLFDAILCKIILCALVVLWKMEIWEKLAFREEERTMLSSRSVSCLKRIKAWSHLRLLRHFLIYLLVHSELENVTDMTDISV